MLHEEINNEQEEQKIIEECCKHGTANLSCVPQKLKELFRCANDISPEWHVRVLAQIQKYIDNAVSKTVNMPENATKEDVKQVYELAFKLGCKGITIYRNNSRQNQTFQIGNNKNNNELKRGDWKQIADDTIYYKRKLQIGCGKLKLFIGYSEKEKSIQDIYVVRSGLGGCERNLQGMVIAMSGMLRLGGNIFNIEKAFEGIGGCNSFISKRAKGEKLSFGSSCGTAILNELKRFLKEKGQNITISEEKNNNKCPECGKPLQSVENCVSCQNCGWSKCS
jgi:ribonucleoside-diphosphate reductase alpha chain